MGLKKKLPHWVIYSWLLGFGIGGSLNQSIQLMAASGTVTSIVVLSGLAVYLRDETI